MTAAQAPCTAPPASPLVDVVIPASLARLFPGCEAQARLAAGSVDQLVDALDRRWPGMRDRLCDSTPRIRRHINVFVGGERASLETRLVPGTEVLIMTAISGG